LENNEACSSLHYQITSQNPFFARCYFLAFVQQTAFSMAMEQAQTHLWLYGDRIWHLLSFLATAFGIENSLAATTSGQINQ